MIKLIATDLDGTLLYPKKWYGLASRKNIEFLKNYVSQGGKVVLVSGRTDTDAARVSKQAGEDFDIVGCNGAIIYHDGKVIEDNPIPFETIQKLYDKYRNSKEVMSWVLFTRESNMIIVPNSMGRFMQTLYSVVLHCMSGNLGKFVISRKRFEQILEEKNEKVYKLMVMTGIAKGKKEVARLLTEKFKSLYSDDFDIYWSNNSVEMVKKDISKAKSLKKLLDVLKLSCDEIAVVGDSGNDIPLFKEFNNSFVMAHSHENIKKEAKTQIEGVYSLAKYVGKGE